MKILIVGGAGYVGSHTVDEAVRRGHDVTIIDNLSNSSLDNLETLRQKYNETPFPFTFIRGRAYTNSLSQEYDGVIYLAARKSVTQGQRIPETYIRDNILDMIPSFEYAKSRDIPFVFSSSAAVYGNSTEGIITTDYKIAPESVYGMTKSLCEQILAGYDKSTILRYFNVAGAGVGIGEEWGRLGNFIPRVYQQLDLKIRVTKKGVYPVRDYVHVLDIANINVDSVEGKIKGIHNVASGIGTSTKQIVDLAGREDCQEEPLNPIEPISLIGKSDFELEYTMQDIIKSCTQWYGKELIQ